ncbi:Zfp839 [Phodopus roborovskii]|uniref:Zfp839 protein n=1 Tax=Phodopus roborovskii TaxID=109678 RepID=A0AAU9ZRT7_PHORO|nr:Zfp839 [Phodopus roborovskii]
MAGAEAEPGSGGGGGGGGSALRGQSHSAVRVAPLDPEQLRRVLEQVTRAQPPRDAGAPRPLPPQQLEAICVKVTSGDTKSKEGPMPPLAAVQPETARPGSQRPGSCRLRLCAPSPQLRMRRVQALGRAGSQMCSLGASPQPPAPPVRVQKPLPALEPVPARRARAPQATNGQGVTLSPLAASGPPVPSSSAHLLISSLRTAHTEKLKKSLKVKTRSGRISRPPKYKARDYKFIKTEDLADGHLSDSDDYSELSVDEEEQTEKGGLFGTEGCALRPKAFRCQACEKSYIGKGGLARHFKLNPGHGQPEPEMSLSQKANGSLALGCVGSQTRGLPSPALYTPATICTEEAEAGLAWRIPQNGKPVEVEETVVPEPESRSPPTLLGPEKYLEPKSGSWASQAEPSTASLLQSGTVQPNSGPAAPSRLSVPRGAQLQEVLKLGGREELVELVLPQLAQVVTLCELLLVKVERSRGARPFFPAVYKEFEELYAVVKRLCQDYLSSSGLCSQEPLEISNDEVARSLGITEFLRKKEPQSSSTPAGPCLETEEKLLEASAQKRDRGQAVEATGEGLTSVKKARTAALPTDVPECPAAISGCLQKPGSSCAPATSTGSAPAATENPSFRSEGSCGEMVPASGRSELPARQQLSVMASVDFEARHGSADPTLPCQGVSRMALYSQEAEPRGLSPAQLSGFLEENVPEHSVEQNSGTIQRSTGVCGTLPSGRGVESLLLGEWGLAGAGDLREMSQPHLRGQQGSHALPAEAAAFPLHSILPVTVPPAACVSKTVPEPGPHPGPDGSLSTNGGPSVGSEAGDVSQFLSRMEADGHRGPETEAMTFEISDVCEEVLSQGQEHIFIQTPNGLILPNPSTGSLLRSGPPERVALEALEAFHTVEAEPSQ